MITSLIFILGLCIGSFLNVLIDRLPASQSIGGRSHCDYCKKQLRNIDLVPIVSFLFLKGKSSCCRKKLSWFYPGVELLTGIVFVLIFLTSQPGRFEIAFFGIASALIVIFFADLKYRIIPDEATIALIIFALFLRPISSQLSYIVAGAILMAGMYGLYLVTKKRGMGFGDVKLAFAIGFLLGLADGFYAIYISFIIGGIWSTYMLLFMKKKLKTALPFGPFLIFGVTMMILFSKQIHAVIYMFLGI